MLEDFIMKYEYALSKIKKIEAGFLFYEVDGKQRKIDLKQSAQLWWDKHNKPSVFDIIFRKKYKNIYAGDKKFDLENPYICLYAGDDEIVFADKLTADFDTSDLCELRAFWDEINVELNKQGYWLFDEG